MDNLFEMPEDLSPMLKWAKERGLFFAPKGKEKFTAYKSGTTINTEGEDVEEALLKLALKLGIKTWNQN